VHYTQENRYFKIEQSHFICPKTVFQHFIINNASYLCFQVHFSNQPQQLLKILKAISQLRQQTDITSAEVISTLQPLLRNQSHLIEELTHLLPTAYPPE